MLNTFLYILFAFSWWGFGLFLVIPGCIASFKSVFEVFILYKDGLPLLGLGMIVFSFTCVLLFLYFFIHYLLYCITFYPEGLVNYV